MCGKVYSSHNTPFHGCSTSSSAHHCRRRITRLSDVLNLYRVLKEMKNVRVRVFDIFLFSSLFAFGALCRSRSCATIRLGCTIFHRIRCCKTIIRTEHEQPPGRKWNSAWTSQPTTHTRIFHSIAFRVLGTVIIWSRCLAYVCRVYVCGLVFGHDSILAPVFMWSPARVWVCLCMNTFQSYAIFILCYTRAKRENSIRTVTSVNSIFRLWGYVWRSTSARWS